MSDQLISREALKKKLQARHDNGEEDFDKGYNIGIETAIDLIDNAPTVEPFERIGVICEENCGYRPQGKLAETLKERIEESVCKYCPTNNRCTLCEISRVFSIITLTAEEQEGGAE